MYQRGSQNSYIEEELTTQSPKEKIQKNKQRSTKHTHKTKDRVTRTLLGKVGNYQRGKLDTVAVCLFDVVLQHFNYIVAVSFIGGGNRRTRRIPPICRKSLTNFITSCCTPSPDRVSNSQTPVVIGTDCIGSCKSNYHTIMTTEGRNITIQ